MTNWIKNMKQIKGIIFLAEDIFAEFLSSDETVLKRFVKLNVDAQNLFIDLLLGHPLDNIPRDDQTLEMLHDANLVEWINMCHWRIRPLSNVLNLGPACVHINWIGT